MEAGGEGFRKLRTNSERILFQLLPGIIIQKRLKLFIINRAIHKNETKRSKSMDARCEIVVTVTSVWINRVTQKRDNVNVTSLLRESL